MELATRAYSAIEVKAMDSKARTFSGWATTPALDRMGDRINPEGIRFKNPVVLLSQHKHDMPIGNAVFNKPSKAGVQFDAELPVVEEGYGSLKDRVDTAWGELKYGLVRAVSIGFRPLKYSFTDTGVDYEEIEVFELSAVSIPALSEAIITAVRNMQPLSSSQLHEIKHYSMYKSAGGIPLVQVEKKAEPRYMGGSVKLLS